MHWAWQASQFRLAQVFMPLPLRCLSTPSLLLRWIQPRAQSFPSPLCRRHYFHLESCSAPCPRPAPTQTTSLYFFFGSLSQTPCLASVLEALSLLLCPSPVCCSLWPYPCLYVRAPQLFPHPAVCYPVAYLHACPSLFCRVHPSLSSHPSLPSSPSFPLPYRTPSSPFSSPFSFSPCPLPSSPSFPSYFSWPSYLSCPFWPSCLSCPFSAAGRPHRRFQG
mmetsp:Transcript_6724/g.18992  ORF Transcript_6724/g.18992 Transcript_6724/m.18992 type:complete len:220 (-) Transcript_6724:3650-4309(-)